MRQFTHRFQNLNFLKTNRFNCVINSIYKSQSFKLTTHAQEIKVQSEDSKYYYPIRGFPAFTSGSYTVFENKISDGKLPLLPYEVKECAMKGFLYTLFTVWLARFATAGLYSSWGLIPYWSASLFVYQYAKVWHFMLNAITKIELLENGTQVRFEFKNLRKSIVVDISRIKKLDNLEKTVLESFAEPYLLPIEINYEDIYGKQSFRSTKKYFIYGDSHTAIRDGEIFRAIINAQSIKLN